MKKLKNPRKYVEKLKKNIRFLEDVRSNMMATMCRDRGIHWFWCKTSHTLTWENPNSLVNRNVGDRVICHGVITEIKTTLGSDSHCIVELGEVRVRNE